MVARQPSVSVRQKEVHLGPQDPALGRTRKPHEHMCGGDIPAKLPQGGLRLLPVHVLYFLNSTSNTALSCGAPEPVCHVCAPSAAARRYPARIHGPYPRNRPGHRMDPPSRSSRKIPASTVPECADACDSVMSFHCDKTASSTGLCRMSRSNCTARLA